MTVSRWQGESLKALIPRMLAIPLKFMPQDDEKEVMRERIKRRAEAIKLWLEENGIRALQEQRHLNSNTQERVYWHFGYMVALRDVLDLIFNQGQEGLPDQSAGIPDTLRSIH